MFFIELKNHVTLICVAAFILFTAWRGYKKGFMITVLSLGSVVVTLLIDYLALPFCMDMVGKNAVLNYALDDLSQSIAGGMAGLIRDHILTRRYLLSDATQEIVKKIIVFIAIFIIMQIILRILLFAAHGMKKIRFIDWLDRILGAVSGVAEGLIFVWIIMMVIFIFYGNVLANAIIEQIFENEVLTFLYYINPVNLLLERLWL